MNEQKQSIAGRLTQWSLTRRITVLVLLFTILVVGVIATIGVPLELLPRGLTDPTLTVTVPWREAPVREVLEKISLPLEEELNTVKGLNRVSSWSTTNRSAVFLNFKQGVDLDVAYREVKDRVERARVRFPDDADKVYIQKNDATGIPVGVVGIAIDENILDTYNLIQKDVVLAFQRIEGVASVEVNGLEPKEIIIEVDREKMEGHGLNIYDLSQQLAGDNFTMASGHVRDSGKKFLLRSVARYKDLEQLENRPVTSSVRLKDIANVRYEEAEKNYSVRVNSQPAYAAVIFKEGEANTIEVSNRVRQTLTELGENPRLKDLTMLPLFIQGDIILNSLGDVVSSGRIGGIFAVIVLFFFLRRFRLTGIITLSIPISLLMALVVMYFAGESLNIISLLALVICIGLLVDNSVVVAENIHRRHQEGLPLKEACVVGAGEIGLAITMATLTTIVVFLPVSLVEGQAQFFLLRLSIPITVSLLASLMVALVFIPLATYLTLSSNIGQKEGSPIRKAHLGLNLVLRGAYNRTFGAINHFYSRILALALRHRLELVFILLLIFSLTILIAFKQVEFKPVDDNSRSNFEIFVDMPRDYTFEETQAFFRECEQILDAAKADLPLDYYFIFHRSHFGEIQGAIDTDSNTKMSVKEITRIVHEKLPEKPGITYYLGDEDNQNDDKSEDVFTAILQGDDFETLDRVVTDVQNVLLKVPGVISARKGNELPPNELALVIDRERASQAGVSARNIAGVVGYSLRGSALPDFRDEGREIPVRVRFEEEDRKSLAELGQFEVPSNTGSLLSLDSLTDTKMMRSPRGIFRRDKRISRTITLELEAEDAKETRQRLTTMTRLLDLPEGIRFGSIVSTNSEEEDLQNLFLAVLLSMVFIYLLMGFLFESFMLPLSIIITIPLAVIGLGWVHFIAGRNIDFLGLIGMVLLVGVVVNNGIVLIDYVIRLQDQGRSRTQALLEAADLRFRPIAMTALTTIFGMVPLTFAKPQAMGLDYMSFGLTLIGGMTTATLLTLLVVPVFYSLFDDARNALLDAVARGIRKKPGKGTAIQPENPA